MVALLLVAIIVWTVLRDDFSAANGIQAVSVLPAPTVETGANVVTGKANAIGGAAPHALIAATLPGSGSVQELSFAPKNVVAGLGAPRARWTPTPVPTDTPTPGPTPVPTFVSDLSETSFLRPLGLAPAEKWIDVNVASQTLVAYEGGLPVFQSLVSTGKSRYPTVTGQFRIWLRFQSQDMNGYRLGYDYYLRNVPYVQYFYQDYALHGTFWHNNFGTPMSHGCVNLPTPAAEWLFNWSEYGTLVNVHG
jgi:lipoprotein-anchoring transpeptidase ErfK/SrfK